jgi:hypothetical protein
MKRTTRYVVQKNLLRMGSIHGLHECPDVCESKHEAVHRFKEAFRSLLGKSPSVRQVERVRSGKTLAYRWRGYVWNFSISKAAK